MGPVAVVSLVAAALTLPQAAVAAEPVAGAQTSGDALFPNVGNGGYDVQHYDVDLAWTPTGGTVLNGSVRGPAATIDATTSVQAVTTGGPLSSFSLDFEGSGLTVTSLTVNGTPATFVRDEQPSITRHKLIVTPATPVEGTFTTVVAYNGTPSRHTDPDGSFEGWNVTSDGATMLNQPVGAMTAFPANNTPGDKATYTIDVDIPDTASTYNTAGTVTGTSAAAAASNGELIGRVPSGAGRTTWRWQQLEPMATELFMVSIGRYDVVETTIDLADGRTIPEWSFVDTTISTTTKTAIATQRARQKAIIDGLATIFGPYPGNSTGVVVDVVPSGISYALETQDRSFFPGSISANTLVHEIAHQWFGNNVSPTVWNEIWIAEGMGTWAPTYYNNAIATPSSGNSSQYTYWNTWNNTASTSTSWTNPPGAKTGNNPATLYSTFSSYTRPGMMYEALRLSLGDADYVEFLTTWQTRYAGTSRTYADFLALAEEVSGRDLDAFLQDWILDADKPAWPQRHDLSLTSVPADGATDVEPGDTVTFTLSAANQGRVALSPAGGAASVATVDLSDVLDDADLDAGSLPAGLALDGTTLTWTVPTTAAATFASNAAQQPTVTPTSTVSFDVVVGDTASLATLAATAQPGTLGGVCTTCTSSVAVPIQPVAPTADPVVTGTPAVGGTLTADTAGWAAGTTFTYQWAVGGTDVAGATGSTYVPVAGDVGSTVTVAVTGSLEGYSPVTLTSEPTAPVALGTLTDTPVPTVTGTPQVASPLTAVAGAWDDGVELTYQWLVDGEAVAGATGTTYTPAAADVGKPVTVAVTGTRAGYTTVTRTSAPTEPVALGELTTGTPVVSGVAKVRVALTADPGDWDEQATLTYQWLVDGEAVAGATGTTYTPVPADLGEPVTVAVTGTRTGYAPETETSAATPAVAPGDLVLLPTPAVSGTNRVGELQIVFPGDWEDGVTLSYQWFRGGVAIPGATAPTYRLAPADLGRDVRVAVTGSKPGYESVRRVSVARAKVAPGLQSRRPRPTFTGQAVVGKVLTARPGARDAGVRLAYRWFVGGKAVAGPRGSAVTFRLRGTDRGKLVRVRVRATKPGYVAVVASSDARRVR